MPPIKIISVEKVSKYYGNAIGVKDISFDVQEGDIFGFLGPNGAGKTTTIRLLLDLLRPTSGLLKLFGMNVSAHSFQIRKKCGYLPGEFTALSNLTGLEFFRLLSGLRQSHDKPNHDFLDRFGLSKQILHRKIRHLSHGTIQKLGIIQALMNDPELLILDEPTTGLDPLMQEVFYELLLERQKNGCTIFFSSHILMEVERLCSHVAIIKNGEIVGREVMADLKNKAERIIELTLSHPVADLKLPNAILKNSNGLTYTFAVDGGIEGLLTGLAKLPVADISISKPGLENLFMKYYTDTEND